MRQRRLLLAGTALILSILIYICTAALIQLPVASAHAYVIGSDPVDGSTVAKIPEKIHIYFNAAISPLSRARVYYIQNGNLIGAEAAASQVAPSNARELVIPLKNPNALPQGSYEIIWSTVANNDGHTTYGIIGFNVGFSGLGLTGTPVLGPGSSNDLEGIHAVDTTGLLAMLWGWFVLAALTAWVGILVIEQFVLRDGGPGAALLAQVRKRTYSLQRLCLATLLFGQIVELFLRVVRQLQIHSSGNLFQTLLFGMITKTSYGHIWLLRMILVVLALGLLYWTHRSRKGRPALESAQSLASSDSQSSAPIEESQAVDADQIDDTREAKESGEAMPVLSASNYRVAWLLLAGLLTLLFVLAGPVAQVLQPTLSVIFFDWLKHIAQSVWFGGFAYLGYVLWRLLRAKNGAYDREALITLQQRLTPFLLASIGIQLVSLLFLSDASIRNPQQLLTDPYGRTQLVQLIIVAIIVLLSAYILFVLRPRIIRLAQLSPDVDDEASDHHAPRSRLSKIGRHSKITTDILSMLGAGVLLCSALMSFFAPPIVFPDVTYANRSQLPTGTVNMQTKQIGTFSVTLELLPGRSGEVNTVVMLINDSEGEPITDAQVRLDTNMQIMNMGTSQALITGGNPVYATNFEQREVFNMAGLWIINVEIQRPGQQPAKGTFQIMLS